MNDPQPAPPSDENLARSPRPRREFPVDAAEDGSRLETFLRQRLGLARNVALKAVRKGWVRVDGKRAKPERRLARGETVKITNYGLPLPLVDGEPEPGAPPPRPPGEVVQQARASLRHRVLETAPDGRRWVVSCKPAGRVVHVGSGHVWGWADAVAWALAAEAESGDARSWTPIGRLDRDTSGLLVLAEGRAATRPLFSQLKDGRLQRIYTAQVAGAMQRDQGTVRLPLRKEELDGQERMVVDRDQGKPSETGYRVVRRLQDATLVACTLASGRTHQIRAHLAALGNPLLGDPRYGTQRSQQISKRLGVRRLFLHAGELVLEDPETGEELRFAEPLPEDLAQALR